MTSSLRMVYGADESVAIWVSSRIKGVPDLVNYRNPQGARLFHSIGVADESGLIAGAVFHNYVPAYGNIEISMAASKPLWAQPEVIGAILFYPFVTLGCERITTLTPAKNKRALKFNEKMGFVHEGVVRKGFGDDDMVINGLLKKEAAEFLRHYGQEIT